MIGVVRQGQFVAFLEKFGRAVVFRSGDIKIITDLPGDDGRMVLHVIDQRSQGGKIKLGHDAHVASSRVVEKSEIRLSAGGVKGRLQDAKTVVVDGEQVLSSLVPIAFANP